MKKKLSKVQIVWIVIGGVAVLFLGAVLAILLPLIVVFIQDGPINIPVRYYQREMTEIAQEIIEETKITSAEMNVEIPLKEKQKKLSYHGNVVFLTDKKEKAVVFCEYYRGYDEFYGYAYCEGNIDDIARQHCYTSFYTEPVFENWYFFQIR